MTTSADTLRKALGRNSTAQLMEGVLEAGAEYNALIVKIEALHRGDITDTAEAYVIRYAAREIVKVMESAVTVRDMVEEREDIRRAAKTLGLDAAAWAPDVAAYETGHENLQARIEDAIRNL